MDTQEIIALEQKYVVQTYKRPPFVIERGDGCTLYDSDGHAYIDLVAGIAVNALGHGDRGVLGAIMSQASKLIHVSNLYHSEPQARLAGRLCQLSFADKAYFCNSGAEATEGAFKFARAWAKAKGEPDRVEIVAFTNAFHGRTFAALAATDREKYQAPFRPLLPGVRFAKFNDLDSAEQAIGDKTCAVIVEPVQGEGGIHVASDEFLAGLRRLCDRRGALLIFDEVQCGLGRTGALWAHQHCGVIPDMMTLAKPLGGGLPIGAVLVTQSVADAIHPGDHGTTFGGNALICAVAQAVLDRISEPEFLTAVSEKGAYLMERLHEMNSPHVLEIRGRGLMVGLELDMEANKIVQAGYGKGLILVNAGDKVLRMVPPLIISRQEIDITVERLTAILAEL
ncbi:MAG: aspartate aminotransferase family protein [Anaerolineae bacterium]|nr:aspartate aminotransferase family protein [Anaerolineae bacterium]